MTETTAEFFQRLDRRGSEAVLGGVAATVRFDVADVEHTRSWWLDINNGAVRVSRDGSAADCVLAADQATFDRLADGSANAMAAVLRGELAVSGNPDLLVAMQRLFPGPRRSGDRPVATAEGGRAR
jgi:hypothetical protein